jgi:drug/metabolite transporter (DMT)-like permease
MAKNSSLRPRFTTSASPDRDTDEPGRALAWMAGAALCFSVSGYFVKNLATTGLPTMELVFYRSLINAGIMLFLMLKAGEPLVPKGDLQVLLLRGVAGFLSLACLFYSLSQLPLSIAMMIAWCSPIFVIFFSAAFLNETLGWPRLAWAAAAFYGLTLLVRPDSALEQGASFPLRAVGIGLAGAASAGLAYVAVRAATARVGVNTIVFYFTGISTLISLPFIWADYQAPHDEQITQILGMALSATAAQYMMTQGYRFAKAGVVSLMNLLTPAFSAIIGWLLLKESLSPGQFAGMVLIAGAILGLSWKKKPAGLALPRE